MKLAPIRNPHSKTSKVEKLTKREEKVLLLQKTKLEVLQKFGSTKPGGKGGKKPVGAINTGTVGVKRRSDDEFKLGEKVTKESQGIKLLQEGYLQSFIDFFYLTNETTPAVIQPSQKLLEEYKMNKSEKHHLELSEESLVKLSEDLVEAENYLREGHTIECLHQYEGVCNAYERLNDYETASYFYQRCLEVSKEAKYIDGEAKAYMGLGICEEKVFNIFESMKYHETALEKAIDGNLPEIIRKISQELVRVYNNIAKSYEQKHDFGRSLEYFEKCLDACKKADDPEMEAK
jgi:tetratricopeptide (TPR) repeat protein